MGKIKICAFSDMHGNLDFNIEPCDIVLIGGDIIPLYIQNYSKESNKWFKKVFIPWCNELPCDKVVFVAGNHDFWIYRHQDELRDMLREQDKIIYLDCETFEYKGKVIFGTPWCKIFGTWAFMESYDEQDKRYEKCLEGIDKIDVILSHDAPYGVSDVLLQKDCWWVDGSHIGNESLKRLIERIKPKLVLHGHLHSTTHSEEMLGDTSVYNVSLLDENYNMVYLPTYIEIV